MSVAARVATEMNVKLGKHTITRTLCCVLNSYMNIPSLADLDSYFLIMDIKNVCMFYHVPLICHLRMPSSLFY